MPKKPMKIASRKRVLRKRPASCDPNFPLPKKGRARMILKHPASSENAAKEKQDKKLYKSVPYVRHGQKSQKSRNDRAHWCCSLADIYSASEKKLLDMLMDTGILYKMSHGQCPHCEKGKLSKLVYVKSRDTYFYKCGSRSCRHYIAPHYAHPVFIVGRGSSAVPLREQAAALFCAVANVSQAAAHLMTKRNHKFIEGVYDRFHALQAAYVEKQQMRVRFGQGHDWPDIEADEVDLRKTIKPEEMGDAEDKDVHWEQWGGLVERGNPRSLVLMRLKPAITNRRAPGPGAMRKRDWKPIATKFLKNKQVVLHTDGAKAYKMAIPGVVHDNVVHQKKRVVNGNKVIWKPPNFVKVVQHTLPNGSKLHVKAGTQIVDRAWRHIRAHLMGNSSCVISRALRRRVRSAQWFYWNRGEDLWKVTGDLISKSMSS